MSIRSISYGGGVQSTALLVLAAQRVIDFDVALFANVGDDSEHPATLEYVRNVAVPFGEKHGIAVHELHRVKRDGTTETLMGRLIKPGSRSLPIPVRMENGAPGTRLCTHDFKIAVVGKWLKANGAHGGRPCRAHRSMERIEPGCGDCKQPNRATVGIGISTDEFHRASNKRAMPYESPVYPLIELGYDRSACQQIIADAGLPVPPKSSCFFCPFHRPAMWAEMRRDEPELFEKSAQLEDLLNDRRRTLGKDPVYLTRFALPLRQAIGEAQDMLPGFDSPDTDTCDEGYCWT